MKDEDELSKASEVQISYVRSKDGKTRTIPVWFTLAQGKVELLPMYGLKTKWFLDVERAGKVGLKIGAWAKTARPEVVRDPRAVEEVKKRFGKKYGEGDVRRYYPTSEVALEVSP